MPYIKQDFIDNLLRDSDIVEVFRHFGDEPKKKGANFFCSSPFTDEKTGSCWVQPKTQIFKDFSSGKSGNAITYIKHKKNCSYPEAIEELAKIVGKSVEYEKPELAQKQQEKQKKQKDLRKYLEGLHKKFQEELHKLPKDHAAWKEIQKRGYTKEDVEFWGLGFAPGNNFIYNLFSTAGNIEAGKKLGLINDKNNDKLWNKLIYPIFDGQNKLSGFASRQLDNNSDFAKWMNPSENELYDKSRILFGLNIAKSAIIKQNRVWIVEGYNDVIAWHNCGIENTVGVCGTSFTDKQMSELKKLTSKITLCFDGDNAGKRAYSKYIPALISKGFSVEICQLPNKLDPDDYSRIVPDQAQTDEFLKLGMTMEQSLQPFTIAGFEVLLLEKLQGEDLLDRTNGIKEVVKVISKIPDVALRELYTEKLTKEAKLKPTFVKALFKSEEAETVKLINSGSEKYELPLGVKTPISELEPIIDKYELFIDNNQIYMQETYVAPVWFRSISNFSIEILQHMNDDKFPKKLLRVCNIKGEERIFDVAANALNSPQRFRDALTDNGNYQFYGNQKDLDKLTAYLFDNMGVGRKVDVLGWNAEGFFCWNNSVTVPGQKPIPITKNGIFHFDGHTYYVPSANEIYRNNPYRFNAQKKVILKSASFTMEDYLGQIYKVHREFAIPAILFAFASAHQDLIFDVAKGFPEFFLFGPASTGKDQLFSCIKRMFGFTETDLTPIGGEISTNKGIVLGFAEFSNMVNHLSEYTNVNSKMTEMLKELWGKNGYKRGNNEGKFSTELIPILSSAIIAGNEHPSDTALLSRLIFGEMTKFEFTEQEREEYKKLAEMLEESVTSFMDTIIWNREIFEKNFKSKFNLYKKTLSQREAFNGAIDRIITNYAILGATYQVLADANVLIFPFTFDDMLKTFDSFASNLRSKISSASIFIKFWDLFQNGLRGNTPAHLKENRDYRIDGNMLFIQFTNVFTLIQREWFPRFNESCPSKKTFQDEIKNEKYFAGPDKKKMIVSDDDAEKEKVNATTGYNIDLSKMPDETRENIQNLIYWQRQGRSHNGNLFDDSPATPNYEREKAANSDDVGDLGF